MSQDLLTVGSTMRIPLLYRGEYSQWVERFMKYLEQQTDGEAMINSIKNEVKRKSDSEGSEADDFSELKKITTLLAKAFNQRKFYSKPTNNLRTSSTSQSSNKKQEFVKSDDKQVVKKDDEKRDMSRVKCYNYKKEGHFAKDCKKAKVIDYEYYKTKMLLTKKDKNEQVLLAEDQAWMESSSDLDQEINANMVFMAQIEKQKSSLKPYVPNVILEKIIIDLEDEVVNLLEKEKFRHFYNIRRPKNSGVIWKKKGSSNTSNVGFFAVSVSNLNKNVKRYSRKDLLACNISHLRKTTSASVCNDAMNVSCNPRMYDLLDDNNLFIFDDVNVRISPVSKMPFRKKPRDSMHEIGNVPAGMGNSSTWGVEGKVMVLFRCVAGAQEWLWVRDEKKQEIWLRVG
nr:hypothetical protein [Tanacetum cinerariifolium]